MRNAEGITGSLEAWPAPREAESAAGVWSCAPVDGAFVGLQAERGHGSIEGDAAVADKMYGQALLRGVVRGGRRRFGACGADGADAPLGAAGVDDLVADGKGLCGTHGGGRVTCERSTGRNIISRLGPGARELNRLEPAPLRVQRSATALLRRHATCTTSKSPSPSGRSPNGDAYLNAYRPEDSYAISRVYPDAEQFAEVLQFYPRFGIEAGRKALRKPRRDKRYHTNDGRCTGISVSCERCRSSRSFIITGSLISISLPSAAKVRSYARWALKVYFQTKPSG